jgi:NADPH2:quinone reductase
VLGFVIHASPTVHAGSWAELIAVPEDSFIAAKPDGVGTPEAGAATLAGVTALVAVDALRLGEGDTVLIVGATGGVGGFAVQLAVAAGAHVIATALPEDHDYLRALGAEEVVDRGASVADDVRERHPDGVDALLDTASFTPDDFEAHAAALREGGRGASPVSAAGDGPGRANVMGSSDPANVGRLAGLLGEGGLRAPIQRTFGLDAAGEALAALAGEHTQGKLAITIA